MTRTNFSSRTRIAVMVRAAAPPAILILTAALLMHFPPAQYSFYPRCPIYEFLHLQCPGCGATRAIATLLHGHLAEAMRFNGLVTLLLPFAAAYGVLCYRRFLQRKSIYWPQPRPVALCAAFALVAVFTVIRNLPLRSF